MKTLKTLIRKIINSLGYNIVRLSESTHPRSPLVDQIIDHKISVVLDVGANIGQFAQQLRYYGYHNKIISFEPVSVAYKQLKEQADVDPLWETVNLALGASSQQAKINVSRNSVSSSILPLEKKTLTVEPTVEYVYSEPIIMEPLDKLFSRYITPVDLPFMKVDVQGYENQVVKGAEKSLCQLAGVVIECSLSSLYEGEWLLHDVFDYFYSRGFILTNIERVFTDKITGELLQVDTIFWNTNRAVVPIINNLDVLNESLS